MLPIITASLLAVSLSSTDSIKDFIHARAIVHNYSPIKALAIAECESGFVPTAKSSTSSAQGIFQFINGTWYGVMAQMGLPTTTPKTDPLYNIEAAMYLLDRVGDRPWKSSQGCWQPKYMKYLNESLETPLEAI